ncbi:uncharacterized protein LOC120713350 [Panicum virgatum]|uniref:uncharacterized protein LOC120713350 n=1 Tax=Panicum virgatum TaxID=38727 RepID=UPI0019D52120|nr:uncharacterized protein LOC120713350 [Panicum virgatum]
MDRPWVHSKLFSPEHIDGVKEFMSFIREKFSDKVEILCPCGRCLNQKYQCQAIVKKHILINGMDSSYTRWIHHGENSDEDVINDPIDVHDIDMTDDDNYGVDPLEAVLGDLNTAEEQTRHDGENLEADAEPDKQDSFFKIAMREAKRQLYPGCTKFSRFSFVVKLLHMKSLYRISNSAFSAVMKLLTEAFPEWNTLPKSYNEAKSLLKELGLGYESIHVCSNNCALFRKKYAKLDNCHVCGLSRWKDPERKKIPKKKDQDEEAEKEHDAFELFQMCHFSKKKGYTPAVQSVITEMDTQLAAQPTEGEQPKSVLQVVANVLERNNKKSVFLQYVGMQTKQPRLSAQLEAEKRENAELRLIVSNQREQMEGLSKKQAELEAKLDLALGAVLELLLPLLLESNCYLYVLQVLLVWRNLNAQPGCCLVLSPQTFAVFGFLS